MSEQNLEEILKRLDKLEKENKSLKAKIKNTEVEETEVEELTIEEKNEIIYRLLFHCSPFDLIISRLEDTTSRIERSERIKRTSILSGL